MKIYVIEQLDEYWNPIGYFLHEETTKYNLKLAENVNKWANFRIREIEVNTLKISESINERIKK